MGRSRYTSITPLPPTVSRETALEFVHDHAGMIALNPLVIRHEKTEPHPNATPEEAKSCIWYAITDKIQYIPGLAESELTYKGGFYDLPNGIQTHVFAPAGVDIRAFWRVGGNMPGEARETPELGVDTPRDGLYLREDVDLKCSMLMTGFVKRNLKKSHATLVDALVAKAEIVEKDKAARKSQIQADSGSQSLRSGSDSVTAGNRTSQPCGCIGTLHAAGCPLYYNSTYGSLSLPRNDEQLTPITKETTEVQRLNSETDSTDYSPVAQHPCYCKSGGVHVSTCQFYPDLVRPPSQKFPRPSPLATQSSFVPGEEPQPPGTVNGAYLVASGTDPTPSLDTRSDGHLIPQALRPRSSNSGTAMELDGFPVASGKASGARPVELE